MSALPAWFIPAAATVFGLVIGSFLNVVIWRVPRGESIVTPRSACPKCGHTLTWWEDVPLLSWVVLRGRCRECKQPISIRYPLVEAATGAIFGLAFWYFGFSFAAAAFAYLGAIGLALSLIDLDVHRLPDAIVLPGYAVLAALFVAQAVVGADGWWPLLRALIGGLALFMFYFLAAIIYPGGMGFGDVKLAGVLGFALGWLGWGQLLVGAFAAFLLGGLFSVALLMAGKAGRRSGIPFGPWMIVGAGVGVAAGNALWEAYLGTMM
ncbi:leader peptidase (prepilin peptidase)/N-methyltransferase [Rarobacter incanus]|uniref:Prepilin leader peptidase/N-methyltransferase n=1 Tax=Rarobacter incanus TaxID=153494 RepID=A0A542SLV4_9MICO|nr:leader peptidase (prepilin peptidase)/N-methyltransferase [Rarobacter incanus]